MKDNVDYYFTCPPVLRTSPHFRRKWGDNRGAAGIGLIKNQCVKSNDAITK
jgi:hypothetical protein